MSVYLRSTFLVGVSSVALFASPASAQCVATPAGPPLSAVTVTGSITCSGNVTTTDDTYDTTINPERNYEVDTTGGPVTLTINSGATINSAGLAVTHVDGDGDINVINNGNVQHSIDTLNGGVSALQINAFGAADVNYSGEGSVSASSLLFGHGLDFYMQGTGNLVATVGAAGGVATTISTTTQSSAAIQVNRLNGDIGSVSLTTTSDTTLRGTVAGINVDANGSGTMTVNNAATILSNTGAAGTLENGIRVRENATGTGNIAVTNTGAIGTAADRTSAAGILVQNLNGTSNATINVSGSGAIYTAGVGVQVGHNGSGTATINYSGAINSTGATGVLVNGSAGLTSVTLGNVTAATDAVFVTRGGDQTITLNGVTTGGTTGLVSATPGPRLVNVGTAGNVTGGTQAIAFTGGGGGTLNNAGIIGASGASYALNATSTTAAVNVNNGTTTNAAATLNGRLTFGSGNDILSNYGTWNTQGTTDFGAGNDEFFNRSTGIINLAGATTWANLEGFAQQGTINLQGRTLTATGVLSSFGTINFGASGAGLLGFSVVNNDGTMNLATGTNTVSGRFNNLGTLNARSGATTLTGQTLFDNTGIINLVDSATDDTLTINSSYMGGANAALALDVDQTTADRLIVTGAISGTTRVNANLLSGALADGGVLIVDGQSTSTANAFTLGTLTGASGLVDYSIRQDGSDYYLDAAMSLAGFSPLQLGAAVVDLWYPSADEVLANLAVPDRGTGLGFWINGYVGEQKFGDRNDSLTLAGNDYDVDNRIKSHHLGLQGGIDYGVGETGRVGLTAGWSRHRINGIDDAKANGWNLGAFYGFGGALGFHGDLLAKYDRYKARFVDGPFDDVNSKVRAFGLDGSLGYRLGMGGSDSSLDLAIGASQVWNKIRGFSADALRYSFDDFDSTRGRVSARYNLGGSIQPYVQGTLYHEFADGGTASLNDGVTTYAIKTAKRGTWGRVEAGIGGATNAMPTLAAWADLGDVKGFGARLGMRFGAGSEAPAPAPVIAPAPPPAPAPATQTCYDGSVILATDTCPLPPAPPPPAAAPERG